MKICFIGYADSIHTQRWVEYFCNNSKNEAHILTIAPCTTPIKGAVIHNLSASKPNQLSEVEDVRKGASLKKSIGEVMRNNRFGNLLTYLYEQEFGGGSFSTAS